MSLQTHLSKIELEERFSSNEACERQLFEMKWPRGFACPRCGKNHYYTISTRRHPLYECSQCGHQASATASTIFEKTHIPLPKWFSAIYAVFIDNAGYSAIQLSKDACVSYPTAWLMMHKIREGLSNDAQYRFLLGVIGLDEAYFEAPEKSYKRGRGATKAPVSAKTPQDALDLPHAPGLKLQAIEDGEALLKLPTAEGIFSAESSILIRI
ncbi:MAG: transposase [Clostridiales bacterium]|nr:transposase [Clostridiales bacterium]